MNKAEILFDAVTDIRPELIEEAQAYVFRRRGAVARLRPYLAAAACFVLVAALGWNVLRHGFGGSMGMDGSPAGGSSGGDSWNGSRNPGSADPSPGVTGDAGEKEPPPSADSAGEDTNRGETPTSPGKEEADQAGGITFTAAVRAIREEGLLVEVLSGDDALLSELVLLPAEEVQLVVDVDVGDYVFVTWSGTLEEMEGGLTVTGKIILIEAAPPEEP